jgi:hypothetical protein
VKIVHGALLVVLGVAPALPGTAAAEGATVGRRPRAVVELFTSQGCANCPPADAFLAEMSHDPELVTLSFPVDYWDYLGWKDTAAKPEFTQRQKSYAALRGDHAIYTPQMVVNGRQQLLGSDRAAVARQVAASGGLQVDVEVETRDDAIVVSVGDAPDVPPTGATVWIARYDLLRTFPIRRGENTGRTLAYVHLVKTLQPIGMWKGKAMRFELPRKDITHEEGVGCAVLVQSGAEGGLGTIYGARVLETPRG